MCSTQKKGLLQVLKGCVNPLPESVAQYAAPSRRCLVAAHNQEFMDQRFPLYHQCPLEAVVALPPQLIMSLLS